MKIKSILASLLLIQFGPFVVSLQAQPVAIQQMQNTQQTLKQQQPLLKVQTETNAPELYPGENQDVGPQRILKLMAPRTWFEVWLDSQVFETSNALLTHNTPQSSAVFVNTIQAAVAPTPFDVRSGKLAPTIGFRSQWYNYSLNSPPNLDFDAQTAFLGARYLFDQKWIAGAELDYTRLLGQQNYSEFYREFVPNFGVQRLFPVNKNLLFSAGWQIAYHFTSVPAVAFSTTPTDVNDRLDNILTLALSYQIAPKLVVQPYYSFEYTYYSTDPFSVTGSSRNDYINSVGLSVSYYFKPNLALRAFVSGDFRESDNSVAEYNNFNGGLDVSLIFRF